MIMCLEARTLALDLHPITAEPQYLDGSSDNFGALSAKLIARDIETRHLAIGRTESAIVCLCPKSRQYC
jgi:hypothetical protein